MYVHQVVSYLRAWEKLNRDHESELNEILTAASNYFSGRVIVDDADDRPLASGSRRQWEKALFDFRWNLNDRTYYSPAGKRVHLGSLGPSKNGISVQINFGNPSWFHRWLFSQGALAVRYAQIRIPVLVAPMREFDRREDRQNRLGSLAYFEYLKDQLETLAPLSSTFPFLILGVSDQQLLIPPMLSELPSDPNITTERVVIDRCIEFPPEYHQAGLGILNYFGSFLRENYPDREAKFRIEQQGLTVRMTVETTDGNVETIEKALKNYELVVTGRVKPEAITTNERVILDMRNEMRIAQFRIESQQDIIDVQNRRIDKLMDVIAQSFHASQSRPIEIQVNPIFHNSNVVSVNHDVSTALNSIYDLLESLPPTEEAHMVLNDLTGSLEAVKSESDPEKLKISPGVTKLGRFLRRLADGNEALGKAVSSVEKGWQIVGDMACTYNKLASFCGLPTILMT